MCQITELSESEEHLLELFCLNSDVWCSVQYSAVLLSDSKR